MARYVSESAPDHLPRHLIFAILAYRIRAERLGDLDHETTQVLDRTDAQEAGTITIARLRNLDQKTDRTDAGHRFGP
jgi:hypothetical protein